MKKNATLFVVISLSIIALTLAGCSPSAAASTAGAGQAGERQLPQSMQLALGTLALEDTDQAITAEQAAALLPLWKAANSLSGADNVAAEETTSLFNQIQETMTSEQVQAIQAMDLSGQNMADLASKYGFQMGGGGRGELTEEMRATMEAARLSGQMPEGFTPGMAPPEGGVFRGEGGGPPLGGQGGGQGFFVQRSDNGSSSGQSANDSTGNPIYQAVIDLLEKKIQ
jgi:hypothetical protein